MKVPKLFSRKKSRSSSLAESSKSSSSRSSSSLSSGAASPTRNSCEITPAAEIRKASPGRTSNASSSAVTRQNSTGKGKGPAENIIEVHEASTSVTARNLEHQELTDAFQLIDVNKDGKISQSELGKVLGSLGYTSSDEELKLMLDAVDTDGDGYIDLEEFINLNTKMDVKAEPAARSKELRAAFSVFDIDKNNFISAEELHQVLKGLGEKSTMEDCSRMIRGVDSDGDGQVNFEEFERMMMRTTSVY